MLSAFVPVDDATRVSEARRLATACAESEGLAEQATEQVAIIATEMATNLLKHAQAGELHISRLSVIGEPGVEILSVDRGPGMDLNACLTDGFSTVGTAGTGLGAISRLADDFDGYSQPRHGTVLVARKLVRERRLNGGGEWTFAAVQVPYPGETACGDNWCVRRVGSSIAIMVADGLGHGILAAEASATAVHAFETGPGRSPASSLELLHLALRSTRGAAVAVAFLDPANRTIRYAGLGNIAGVILSASSSRYMLSHNGTAGLEARRFQEFDYPLPEDATLVMHSDGLVSSWSVDAYPGLLRRHPAVIAGVLYRDNKRGRDDLCVMAGRPVFKFIQLHDISC